MPETRFIPGLKLSESFYREAVEPILRGEFPNLRYSAALIGSGSEILEFDTEMSSDHHWGPRVMLFVNQQDLATYEAAVRNALSEKLPRRFKGYATSYGAPDEKGVQMPDLSGEGPVNHRVVMETLKEFIENYLGFDIDQEIEAADWLTFPEQKLLTITGGRLFHDEIGLDTVRQRFAYYPHDVWLYLLACSWARIEQEEHLMGRAGHAGDEIGSALIAARLVRDLMRLCFLMEKTYAPYSKWFGTAFSKLRAAPTLAPILQAVLLAKSWQERERHLSEAYEQVARLHNRLGITEPMPEKVSDFYGRPFLVISKERFSKAILAKITDPAMKTIAALRPIGSVDQFSDSTDLLSYATWRPALRRLYDSLSRASG